MINFVISLLFVLLSSSSAVYAENEDTYEMVDSFAECAAIQNVLAMIVSKSEEEYLNHFLHQAANGALITAMEFSDFGGYKEDLVEVLYGGHFSRLVALRKGYAETNNIEGWNKEIESKITMSAGTQTQVSRELYLDVRHEVSMKKLILVSLRLKI